MRAILGLAGLLVAGLLYAVSSAAADDLKPFIRGSWSEIMNSHAGRPMIVHFWGMTCAPCRVEMPKWGDYVAAHPGVDLVTVDTDVVAAPNGAPEAFLESARLSKTQAWRFADPYAEKLYFAVDPNWQGEIPMTLLISSDGKMTKLLGAVAMTDVEQWLRSQH